MNISRRGKSGDSSLETLSPTDIPSTETNPPNDSDKLEGDKSEDEVVKMSAAVAELTVRDFDWLDHEDFNEIGIWIFGYGSLCWHQGFEYKKSLVGYVRGFSRRFWQGNTTHRGTDKRPGRVATLIEDEKGIVWGKAFQVKEKEAFSYLNNRECLLGGYLMTIATFHPRQDDSAAKTAKPFPVVLYMATPSNRHWLGDSSASVMADQIVESSGDSGHNVEYVLRLAEFVRNDIPEAVDDHLFALEKLVRSKIHERNLCLKSLMGNRDFAKVENPESRLPRRIQQEGEVVPNANLRQERRDLLLFTSTVSSKKLRCVNIY